MQGREAPGGSAPFRRRVEGVPGLRHNLEGPCSGTHGEGEARVTAVLRRIVLSAGSTAVLSPLIQEARERQRRRRWALLQAAALAAVFGLALVTGGRGGNAQGSLGSLAAQDGTAAVQADVRSVIASFDGALAAHDFTRACSLLDPLMGMATLRTATSEVGVTGGCERRLRAFVGIIGPRLVDELEGASIYSVQVGGSEASGFDAAAFISVAHGLIAKNQWPPVVGVSRNAAHAKVLITCPPLLCTWRFLNGYSLERARSRSVRS
jgi:hypothetical protein